MKKVWKVLLCLVLAIVLALGGLLGWLTATEYRPAAVEALSPLTDEAAGALSAGEELRVVSWNIGYAGLGAASDFFMDGGRNARSADRAAVETYLANIRAFLEERDYDLALVQEADVDSSRTYAVDEAAALSRGDSFFAYNYACPFVPMPFPPMGRVNSGLLTVSGAAVEKAERISLPCPFSWPLRVANLKRCLLVSYLPIEGSDRQLVLVNLHLEAYTEAEGKIAQTRQLTEFLQSEYEKGNYVIAGGDFNQAFPGSLTAYPNTHEENWTVGEMEPSFLPEGFRFVCDLSVPTCRLLNQPYDPADTVNTQYYVIDGFILSPNVTLRSVETVDLAFADSDHNPVEIAVSLD